MHATTPGILFEREPSAATERRNQTLYVVANLLIYFSAPVTYVGILHAGLLHRLGMSAKVANLPESASLAGFCVPLLITQAATSFRPQTIVSWAYGLLGLTLPLLGILLLSPIGPVPLAAVLIVQGLCVGACLSTGQIFMLRCLKAGTRPGGVARALKLAFSIGPVTAVAGSLCSQGILNSRLPSLAFPANYAALFFLFAPCLLALAFLGRMYRIPLAANEGGESVTRESIWRRLRNYFSCSTFATVWIAYLLFFLGMHAMANASLFTRAALNRSPAELSGWIMAIRFGAKSLFGYLLGFLAERRGPLAPLRAVLTSLGVAMVWVSVVPGYPFLLTFAFLGGAELGGLYFPAYVLAVSAAGTEPKNLAVLTLTSVAAAGLPAFHGALTDWAGFQTSFWCAGLGALISLLLTARLPKGTR